MDDMNTSGLIQQINATLHDLCQPLTTLQCRLELASLVGTEDACREAVQGALEDCKRLMQGVEAMREMLHAGARQASTEPGESGQ